MICALAGGVGAARLLRAMVAVIAPSDITAIVNTGDDTVLHGLYVSPDLDTVMYTLAGRNDDVQGWGLRGESWTVMSALEEIGGETWFRLGDRDLATHLFRSGQMTKGASLSTVTNELCSAFGIETILLPMSDDPVRTKLHLKDGPQIGFQEYFVARRHDVEVDAVFFDGADDALPAPGVLDAIADAENVVICPSNPVVSIGPILAVPEIMATLCKRRDDVVAVSPIIAGRALKGPADRLMSELGEEATALGVARRYVPFCSTLVIDDADAHLADAISAIGMRAVVAPTIMTDPTKSKALAEVVLRATDRP